MPEEAAILIVIFGFVLAIVSMKHKHKIEEMRVLRGEGGGVQGDVSSELRKLQEQLHELRDTTTRYDMSFDAALQRLESRVGHMEAQQREPAVQTVGNQTVQGV